MRIAIKYAMDDIQDAITKAIQIPREPQHALRTTISRLAFVAEFSSYFSEDFAFKVFVNASPTYCHPTANDLGPLMAHPSWVSLMMEFREVTGQWLSKKFESFEFKPRA